SSVSLALPAATVPGVDDLAVVAAQLGREPRAFRRVVVRCPFGRPAVTEQAPYTPEGEPFPTTYWLTCRRSRASRPPVGWSGGALRSSPTTRCAPTSGEPPPSSARSVAGSSTAR